MTASALVALLSPDDPLHDPATERGMTLKLVAIIAAGAIAIIALVIHRMAAARRDARRIREGMAALDAPPPPPPNALLQLGYGEPTRWGVVTDDGAMLAVFASRVVMLAGPRVVFSIPIADITSVSAPRSLRQPRRNRYGGEVYEEPLMGEEFELHITCSTQAETLKFQIEHAQEWADAISAARRAPR